MVGLLHSSLHHDAEKYLLVIMYSSYSGSLESHLLFKANANLKPMMVEGNKN
jgi:hypothetical protein